MANDLLSDKPLISSLTSLAYSWTEFTRLKGEYEKRQTLIKKSKLKTQRDNIEDCMEKLRKCFEKIFLSKTKNNMNVFALSQTYLKRAEHIRELLVAIGKVKSMINPELHKNLRKRIKQQI